MKGSWSDMAFPHNLKQQKRFLWRELNISSPIAANLNKEALSPDMSYAKGMCHIIVLA